MVLFYPHTIVPCSLSNLFMFIHDKYIKSAQNIHKIFVHMYVLFPNQPKLASQSIHTMIPSRKPTKPTPTIPCSGHKSIRWARKHQVPGNHGAFNIREEDQSKWFDPRPQSWKRCRLVFYGFVQSGTDEPHFYKLWGLDSPFYC